MIFGLLKPDIEMKTVLKFINFRYCEPMSFIIPLHKNKMNEIEGINIDIPFCNF